MWRRMSHTVDAYFGSAALHVVLLATGLREEAAATFQMLALWYIHPLAR